MKVLIVDDSPVNLKVAKKMIEYEGCIVETVLSGEKCLEMVKNNHYDLILMDIMMPDMDGVETFHKLKEIKDFKTPVVTLTAVTEDGARERFIQEGFADYLSKPLNKVELKKVLDIISRDLNF